MTLDFSRHDAISNAFDERLAAINKAAAFEPSQLQISILQSFGKGSHRLSFFTGTNKGNMALSQEDADEALNALIDNGYLNLMSGRIYTLTFKGSEFARDGKKPIATPPRTYGNSTPTKELYSTPKLNLRDGWDEHLQHKSRPMCSQLNRTVA